MEFILRFSLVCMCKYCVLWPFGTHAPQQIQFMWYKSYHSWTEYNIWLEHDFPNDGL